MRINDKGFFISIFLLFFMFFSQAAHAQQSSTLLIIPFDNATDEKKLDSLKEGLPDLLTAFLAPYHERLTILDRQAINQFFAEKSLSWEGFKEGNSINQLGQSLQAKYVLRGSMRGKANALGINVALYETETTQLLKSFECEGRVDHLSDAVQNIAAQIAEYFKADLQKLSELPVEEDPAKNLDLIYGLGYFHNGQFPDAITYFSKILKDHPDDESARYWLGKSFYGADMQDHARVEWEQFLKNFPGSEKAKEVESLLTEINQTKN